MFAFLIGGTICTIAELFFRIYLKIGIPEVNVRVLTSVTIIVITAVCTGLGVFDRIAKIAGAGTLVPISGFANAVVSPAIDNKAEGMVLGVGAKMFIIA
ncbi:MAG: SpoVA/SpoVAEb family sporulation membrane protein, partial [Clostridia bacterium]|nr:SpoVA/SpoVAEb family sporulation membrane protein [Clostridia bacterium]